MKSAAFGIVLFVMGAILIATPLIFRIVMAAQESNSAIPTGRDDHLSGFASLNCVVGGMLLILVSARVIRPR